MSRRLRWLFDLARRAMPQNANTCPGNVANELDALIPDSSAHCVRDLRGHFGRGCVGLAGFLRLPSVRSVRERLVPTNLGNELLADFRRRVIPSFEQVFERPLVFSGERSFRISVSGLLFCPE